MLQPYGITNDVLIEFQDSSTLVDFRVMDIDPHQKTSIILGKPFLKLVRATIGKMRGIINMKVNRIHEKFIYRPQEPRVLLLDMSPLIRELEKGKMHGGATRAHEKSPLVVKQKATQCYDTQYEAQRIREFFYEIFSMRQEYDACCDKFSSRTDNLNLQVWRRSYS
jgi:hypothetical protein